MIRILEGIVFIDNVDEFLQKLKKLSKETDTTIAALDADKLAGEKHVRFAIEKAVRSFETRENIANDLAKEIMLYASGSRKITKAVKLGIHKGLNKVVLVAVGETPDLSGFDEIKPEPLLAYDNSKKESIMETFGITNEEIQAAGEEKIPQLVIERVALLDVIK
jgi:KEOPS complex subunit Cgi121